MRKRAALILTIGLLALAPVIAGCGAAGEADQRVDDAMESYQSALDRVRELDLQGATQGQIEQARAELDDAWAEVRRAADETGYEIEGGLRTAHGQTRDALDRAGDDIRGGIDEARSAIEEARRAAGSALDSVRGALDALF